MAAGSGGAIWVTLVLTDDARATFEQTLGSKTRGRHGQIQYDLRRDFDVEPEAIRERFTFHFDRFPVAVEVK